MSAPHRNRDGPILDKVGRIVDRIEQLAGEIEPVMPGLAGELRRLAIADAPPMPAPVRQSARAATPFRTIAEAAEAAATETLRYAGRRAYMRDANQRPLTKDELVKWYRRHWRKFPATVPRIGR